MEEMIPKQLAPLYIDVHCYGCDKRVALSYTRPYHGRNYCDKCHPLAGKTLDELAADLSNSK
ncbi:MAG TPA: hypothetical protein ENH85_08960 [Candidatus Scalindua sp.]|nr:hypothetical protein [Candidatus Scalindua sp.]